MIVLRRSGSTIYKDGGERVSYEAIHKLIAGGETIHVTRTSDGRDITDRVVRSIEQKIWTEDEINSLRELYGRKTLEKIHTEDLPKKSVGRIRHQAAALGLTVDRKWQDHEVEALTAMRKAGVSFPAISTILQRPQHSCEVKAHTIGIVYGGRSKEGADEVARVCAKFETLDSKVKGKIAEDLATLRLAEEGFDVWLPYMPQHKTDLVVLKNAKSLRLQVKSAVWETKTGRFRVPLRRKTRLGRAQYTANDVSFFLFVCLGVEAFYVVPFALCSKHGYANLYPHRPKMAQKGFNWEQYRDSFALLHQAL